MAEQPYILEEHQAMIVVRDDLIPGGSKMRFLPYLVEGATEVVFGGPFCGGAPYALSVWGRETGTKVTLFYAKRKRENWHARQIAAEANGAIIREVPHGYMTHVQSQARKYAAEAGALFLPLGFDVPEAADPYIASMRKVRSMAGPVDQVWASTGSGMLARCLGEAFYPIPVFGVKVGLDSRSSKQQMPSNVTLIPSTYKFAAETKATAPFPSCGNYDRKAWEIAVAQKQGRALFWNVLG